MRIHNVKQRSDAWRQLRLGRLTGSRSRAMLAIVQKGEAAARRDLRTALVIERLTGTPQESDYQNADMAWGVEHEADAVRAYESATGVLVTAVGFCEHPELMAGTSPDGLIGTDGVLSIKCPRSANHLRSVLDGTEPAEHAAQNLHELWLTGRPWLDFVSYDPRMPPGRLQMACIRVTRTQDELLAYDAKVRQFLAEVERDLEAISTLTDLRGQLEASHAL